MSETAITEFIGLLFLAYIAGWCGGYLFYVFRRLSEIL